MFIPLYDQLRTKTYVPLYDLNGPQLLNPPYPTLLCGKLVLENNIFKFCQCIFAIGNGWSPSIEQTNFKPLYSRIYKNTLCKLCLVKNWPNGSREEGENVKTLQIDGRTTSDQRNSLKFSAQVQYLYQ